MNALQWNEHVHKMLLWEGEGETWKAHWKKQDEAEWRLMHLHNVDQRYKQDLKAKEVAEKASEDPWPSKTSNRGKKRGPSKTKGGRTTKRGHFK